MKKLTANLLAMMLLLASTCCAESLTDELGLTTEPKPATAYTAEVNSAVYSMLDFADTSEYDNAVRGLIDAPEVLELTDAEGNVIWSQAAYSFLDDYEQAPDTVNPSLWENTRNNHAYGLFEVCPGIYQVRGYDMANLTVIKGDTGWIVFDCTMCSETAQAAMQLIEKNLGSYPVKAVVISHSHADHFGGIGGVIAAEDVADASLPIDEQIASGKAPVIVPEGFAEHAISENIYAGKAMSRRANYQYGVLLTPSVTGKMAQGIGMGQSTGTVTYFAPTYEIRETGTKLTIDGVEMEFQMTPGTEAPAEMNTYFPQLKALWMAENCTGTLHNLYTLRGAAVRDGAAWAKYITEAITLYGDETEVVFQSHNWPHWGNAVAIEYLENSAAVYKFINDQTLTYLNQGYTSDEISNMIELPEALEKNWYTRQYYGTVAHNSKAVYQKYMGWYDANPVNLNPLTPTESAKKWVEYLGDVEVVLRMAKADFDKGEYQWVAQITKELVFADPSNQKARNLCADALEQLGYQAESGAWRNAYLMGAAELRNGNLSGRARTANGLTNSMRAMTVSMLLDYIAILTDANAAQNDDLTLNLTVTDENEQFYVTRKNGVLLTYPGENRPDAQASVTCRRLQLFALMTGQQAGQVQISGDATVLKRLLAYASKFEKTFNVIEP